MHACCMTGIGSSLRQTLKSGLNDFFRLLILRILRLVLHLSPYRRVEGGTSFTCERQAEQGPSLLINVVCTRGLNGSTLGSFPVSCDFLHSSKSIRCLPNSSRPIMARATALGYAFARYKSTASRSRLPHC